MAEFPTDGPVHDRVISYEQRLLRALPRQHLEVDHRREIHKRACSRREEMLLRYADAMQMKEASVSGRFAAYVERRQTRAELARLEADEKAAEAYSDAAHAAREWLYEELVRVRLWLDAFIDAARSYSEVRPGLRRTPEPEPPPENVTIYASVDDFVAEDPKRAERGWGEHAVLAGHDVGYFTWYDYDHPWVETKWLVAHLQESGEIYAVQTHPDTFENYQWDSRHERPPSRVWLFDVRLPLPRSRRWYLQPSPAEEWLDSLRQNSERRPNSLITLAEALRQPPPEIASASVDEDEGLAIDDDN